MFAFQEELIAWDDGTTRNYYDSKVESMYHYAQIIKNDYLRGRDVDTLLKDGNFVNKTVIAMHLIHVMREI